MENSQNKLKLFENKKIRYVWNAEEEEWYFSVVDIVEVLTGTDRPRKYWNDLKKKLSMEGSDLSAFIGQLKMPSSDGKYYSTDVLSTKNILRLIQSIPSPKAEPFKMWLAQIGNDRLEEYADPEKAITRGADYYRAKGYTDGWKNRGIEKESEFAILTNELTKAWSGLSVREYKELKGLKKENLRDNMTNLELVLNMLAEVSTTAISKVKEPETFGENINVVKEGGSVAKNARNDIESRIGKTVISELNATDKPALDIKDK